MVQGTEFGGDVFDVYVVVLGGKRQSPPAVVISTHLGDFFSHQQSPCLLRLLHSPNGIIEPEIIPKPDKRAFRPKLPRVSPITIVTRAAPHGGPCAIPANLPRINFSGFQVELQDKF